MSGPAEAVPDCMRTGAHGDSQSTRIFKSVLFLHLPLTQCKGTEVDTWTGCWGAWLSPVMLARDPSFLSKLEQAPELCLGRERGPPFDHLFCTRRFTWSHPSACNRILCGTAGNGPPK